MSASDTGGHQEPGTPDRGDLGSRRARPVARWQSFAIAAALVLVAILAVDVPPAIDTDRFSVVDISREPHDGDPAHSTDSVLRGPLEPQA